jgi:membrane protein DedA with SNARE-associated domain
MSFGGLGILLIALGDSSFLSLPEGNDLLIVVLSSGRSWGNMAYLVGLTVAGSVSGCMILYSVGRRGGRPLLKRKFSAKSIERAEKLCEKYGLLTVLIPSILPPPLPFKIFTFGAGAFGLNSTKFFAAVLIGRTIRYSIWGILAVVYWNSVKLYMLENLNAIGTLFIIILALIIASTFVIYLHRSREGRDEKAT